MKFGKVLRRDQIREYEEYYISYKRLKQIIRAIVDQRRSLGNKSGREDLTTFKTSAADTQENDQTFMATIDENLKKVDEWTEKEKRRVESTFAKLQSMLENGDSVQSMLDGLENDLKNLDKFITHNKTGFTKIMKKYDKKTQNQSSLWFMTRLSTQPFVLAHDELNNLLPGLSYLYYCERETKRPSGDLSWSKPLSSFFNPIKLKFLVAKDHAFEVKMHIIKHLRAREFGGANRKADDMHVLNDAKDVKNTGIQRSNRSNAVYYDSPNMDGFRARVEGIEDSGPPTFRMKWYGNRHPKDVKDIVCIQQKHGLVIDPNPSLSEPAMFAIRQKELTNFFGMDSFKIVPLGNVEPSDEEKELCCEMQDLVDDWKLLPAVSVSSVCVPYGDEGASVLATMDEEIVFARQKKTQTSFMDVLPTPMSEMTSDCIVPFAYNVLEIVCESGGTIEVHWLRDMLRLGCLIPISEHYSKFIHAAVECFRTSEDETLDDLPIPEWINTPEFLGTAGMTTDGESGQPPVNKDGQPDAFTSLSFAPNMPSRGASEDPEDPGSGRGRANTLKGLRELQQMGQSGPNIDDKAAKPIQARSRIEPKTFFANERTLLQWLSTCVMVMVAALALLNVENEIAKTCGAVLAPSPLLLMIYALWNFNRRCNALEKRENASYNDKFGATVVVVILFVVFGISFGYSAYDAFNDEMLLPFDVNTNDLWEYSLYCPAEEGFGNTPDLMAALSEGDNYVSNNEFWIQTFTFPDSAFNQDVFLMGTLEGSTNMVNYVVSSLAMVSADDSNLKLWSHEHLTDVDPLLESISLDEDGTVRKELTGVNSVTSLWLMNGNLLLEQSDFQVTSEVVEGLSRNWRLARVRSPRKDFLERFLPVMQGLAGSSCVGTTESGFLDMVSATTVSLSPFRVDDIIQTHSIPSSYSVDRVDTIWLAYIGFGFLGLLALIGLWALYRILKRRADRKDRESAYKVQQQPKRQATPSKAVTITTPSAEQGESKSLGSTGLSVEVTDVDGEGLSDTQAMLDMSRRGSVVEQIEQLLNSSNKTPTPPMSLTPTLKRERIDFKRPSLPFAMSSDKSLSLSVEPRPSNLSKSDSKPVTLSKHIAMRELKRRMSVGSEPSTPVTSARPMPAFGSSNSMGQSPPAANRVEPASVILEESRNGSVLNASP